LLLSDVTREVEQGAEIEEVHKARGARKTDTEVALDLIANHSTAEGRPYALAMLLVMLFRNSVD
jgi:hypothetical protein